MAFAAIFLFSDVFETEKAQLPIPAANRPAENINNNAPATPVSRSNNKLVSDQEFEVKTKGEQKALVDSANSELQQKKKYPPKFVGQKDDVNN